MKNNLKNIIEYGIYHDNLNKKKSIYGLNNFNHELFKIKNSKFFSLEFEHFIKQKISNSISKLDKPSILLCSGGVDSSLIAIFLKLQKKSFIGYHSYYPKKKLNDLNKLNSLKKFIKFRSKIFNINQKEFLEGMEYSWFNNYFGNTYSPTLYYMFKKKISSKYKYLISGSGPDELFYGMEKYDYKKFFSLKNLKIKDALSILDVKYNLKKYSFALNQNGKEILNQVTRDREKFYQKVSNISKDIFNAQRILSYCTVTNQHIEMYDKLAKSKNLLHIAPFMHKDIISFSLSTDIKNFINLQNKLKDANAGKHHLKTILSSYTSKSHSYSNKLGFYSPISYFLDKKILKNKLLKKLNFDLLEEIFSIDKINKLINKNLDDKDYFFYSLLNVNELMKKI